jgi:uncharacterized protein (DUF608 family)
MNEKNTFPRREFVKLAAGVMGAATQVGSLPVNAESTPGPASSTPPKHGQDPTSGGITYPRVFRGSKLKMISFPLGGVAAGSLGLGGRGQLRDWEIFNRPNQGFAPNYAFPAIWAQSGNAAPVAHVLEAPILPPYQGEDGLGSRNVPGLSRLQGATFSGEYPLAHIDFEDMRLPVKVSLDGFSPFIPHDSDDSGLPVAILRYHVSNPGSATAKVGIVFSIENAVLSGGPAPEIGGGVAHDTRQNELRTDDRLTGLLMSNPGLANDDPMRGSFVLAGIPDSRVRMTRWRGWPKGTWWNSPLLFWDVFSKEGQLGAEPAERSAVGALGQYGSIGPGQSIAFTFILAWHFPNRTPEWCGWGAPAGKEKTVIGNFYCTRFKDAWDAALYTARNLERLEKGTRQFAKVLRESDIPEAVKDAASANLSTLASTTCFRTADGEFHGFEGSNDKIGWCFGNCTHVWNYETVTAFLFPSFSLSLRKAAFGFSQDEEGGIHVRQYLPDGEKRDAIIAIDGHMGAIMHSYLDWRQSGDKLWLQSMWPRIRRAIAFAWIQGGWDPAKSGVAVGAQNNTYDVAFFGPNPLCGITYLGALRAGEEMALAVGDKASADEYRSMFEGGSKWIDANLFNSEFYIQQIKGCRTDTIHPSLREGTSGIVPEDPQFQVGKGCLVDQLLGQYLACVMGLGDLLSPDNVRKSLGSIYRQNYKRTLSNHDNVARAFALNSEAALIICDYGTAARPHIPFPYFAEVMTGFEYSSAVLMLFSGMVSQGVECIYNIRNRYDGEKRNPWDELESGHHYARAMASWSAVVAISGFAFDGRHAAVVAVPRVPHDSFRCFWSTGTGWGRFSYDVAGQRTRFALEVLAGKLDCRSCEIGGIGNIASAQKNETKLAHTVSKIRERTIFRFSEPVTLTESQRLELEVGS